MAQGFVFTYPAYRSGLSSQIVRTNLDAIGSMNAGTSAPTAPQQGMPWLDVSKLTSDNELSLKVWDGGAWRVIAVFPFEDRFTEVVRFTITTAAIVWSLTHSFGDSPVSVQLYDVNGNEMKPLSINTVNNNTVVVTHAFAVAGSAIVIG